MGRCGQAFVWRSAWYPALVYKGATYYEPRAGGARRARPQSQPGTEPARLPEPPLTDRFNHPAEPDRRVPPVGPDRPLGGVGPAPMNGADDGLVLPHRRQNLVH